MRGKDFGSAVSCRMMGITPAYAGKSGSRVLLLDADSDHPRVCGEKVRKEEAGETRLGSPPRMRGKAAMPTSMMCWPGITPAYAGKSNLLPVNKFHD